MHPPLSAFLVSLILFFITKIPLTESYCSPLPMSCASPTLAFCVPGERLVLWGASLGAGLRMEGHLPLTLDPGCICQLPLVPATGEEGEAGDADMGASRAPSFREHSPSQPCHSLSLTLRDHVSPWIHEEHRGASAGLLWKVPPSSVS